MNKEIQMKKENLLDIFTTTEDEVLIKKFHAVMSGYMSVKKTTDVKIITTQNVLRTEREEAACIFDGELYEIEKAIKKITSLDVNIFDDYFYKYDGFKQEDHENIAWKFDRIGAFIEIVFDNVYEIGKILKDIKSTEEL